MISGPRMLVCIKKDLRAPAEAYANTNANARKRVLKVRGSSNQTEIKSRSTYISGLAHASDDSPGSFAN